jgi:hypothetical protein
VLSVKLIRWLRWCSLETSSVWSTDFSRLLSIGNNKTRLKSVLQTQSLCSPRRFVLKEHRKPSVFIWRKN